MIKYIKSKSAYILVCAAALAVFFSVIALYRLNIYAVLYAALLSSLLIIPFAAVRIIKSVNAQKQLLKILKSEEIMLESNSFPETRDSEKQYYTEIIKRLAAEKQTLISDLAIKLRDTDDYYTLWAHQIKTPIAAMHLLLQSDGGTLSRECEAELFKIEQYTEMALGYIRLESGTNDFVITACDTDRIIKSVLKKFSKQFILKKLTLDYKETGLTAEKMHYMGCLLPSPGYTNEIIYLYHAEGLSKSEQHLDDDEFLDVSLVPLEKLKDMCMSGEIADAKTIALVLKTYIKLHS